MLVYNRTRASLVAQLVKNPTAMQETLVQFLSINYGTSLKGDYPGEIRQVKMQVSGIFT